MKTKKDFDCVEMKDDIQRRLYEQRKNMTSQEEVEAIRKNLRTSQSPIAKLWRRIERRQTRSDVAAAVSH